MKRTRAFPVVISGPSGVGKTTLVERLLLLDPRLTESISTTTRAPREGEKEGEAYFFVTEQEFEKLKDGALIEWAVVHGQSYGTPKEFVSAHLDDGREVVLNIDVQGGVAVKKCFPNAAMIFILPPSSGELESRIRERGTDDSEEIRKRLEKAREEIGQAAAYDYLVVNNNLDTAVEELSSIIRAERCRRSRFPVELIESWSRKYEENS